MSPSSASVPNTRLGERQLRAHALGSVAPVDFLVAGALLLLVFAAWHGVLALPLTGEDYVILTRSELGESFHDWRPLGHGFIGIQHWLFGPWKASGYHVVSLTLHALCAFLWYRIASRVLGSRIAGATAAAVFVLGSAVADSLAWVAAVNRPLSCVFGGVALLGLFDFERRALRGSALMLTGLGLQALVNEDAYGTGLLILVFLGLRAFGRSLSLDPSSEARALKLRARPAVLAIAAILTLYAVHLVAIQRFTAGADAVLIPGAPYFPERVLIRTGQVVAGLGLPGVVVWLLVALGAICQLTTVGGRRALLFGALALLASWVPFCFSDPWQYRAYPTQGPVALLLSGAVFALLRMLRVPRAARLLSAVLVTGGIFWLTEGRRTVRLERWRDASAEIAACLPFAQELDPQTAPTERPVLVNLELSTLGLFQYAVRDLAADAFTTVEFLDTQERYETPGRVPSGEWFGRRLDGSYGKIEPPLYFARRAVLEPLEFCGEVLLVKDLDQARVALTRADLGQRAVVEAPEEQEAALLSVSAASAQSSKVEFLEPFSFSNTEGRLVLKVDVSEPVLLVYQEHWLFESVVRKSPDQALLTHWIDRRRVRSDANDVATGEPLPVLRVNAYGFGLLLPAGECTLRWNFALRQPRRSWYEP